MFEKKKSSSGYNTVTQMPENTPILQHLPVENVALMLWVWSAAFCQCTESTKEGALEPLVPCYSSISASDLISTFAL